VVGAAVRHSDECRGLHRHIEGGCDDAQRPAAVHSLDNASFRYVAVVLTSVTYTLLFSELTDSLFITRHSVEPSLIEDQLVSQGVVIVTNDTGGVDGVFPDPRYVH